MPEKSRDNAQSAAAPVALRRPITRIFHGREFVDNYEWLRDKESPDTKEYLEAENSYADSRTEHLSVLRKNIYDEISSRVKQTDMSVPVRSEGFWYYDRTEEGKSYGVLSRLPVAEGEDPWTPPRIEEGVVPEGEEVILDVNALAEGHEFFSLGASSITDSGRYLAYSIDTRGDERFDLFVKDLETGELLEDRLEGIFYGATWAGESYLFYQRVDEAWRPDSVWRHRIGTSQDHDVLVYREEDERFTTGVGMYRSRKYLFVESGSATTSEVRVLAADAPEEEFEVLWPRVEGVQYSVDHAIVGGEDRWVVTHNATGHNFAVGWCPVGAERPLVELDNLIPHSETTRVEGVDCHRDFIVAAYRREAIGRAAVMRLSDASSPVIPGIVAAGKPTMDGERRVAFLEVGFDEEIYSVGIEGNPEWEAPVFRLTYGSLTTPTQVLDYWVDSGEMTVLKQQEVLGGHNPKDYVSYRLWATARDGARIPISVVHRADLDRDRPHPTLLYGYGAYETSIDPGMSIAQLSLFDRGMIFAIAHVRGGGEMGRSWYEQGKFSHKKNTFTDFIDVADALIGQGLSTPDQLVAEGGSAGGLLMGAVANMGGDRFRAIHAAVPFVDPLTSILKPELPLTIPEWEEWGDPYHDPEVYDYMASYSPYENVGARPYPDILATTSLNDTRVLYVEPAKWIAKLRATATAGEFLLKTEMNAGHGGVSGRYEQWRQTAFEYAWIINKATGRTE